MLGYKIIIIITQHIENIFYCKLEVWVMFIEGSKVDMMFEDGREIRDETLQENQISRDEILSLLTSQSSRTGLFLGTDCVRLKLQPYKVTDILFYCSHLIVRLD